MNFDISFEEINNSIDINNLLNELVSIEYHNYRFFLDDQAKKTKEIGNEISFKAFRFLSAIFSLTLLHDNPSQPFSPFWVGADGTRSAAFEDFSNDDIKLLSNLLPKIVDSPFIISRFSDLIFVKNNDFKMANTACENYLKALKMVDGEKWVIEYSQELERGLYLAKILGQKTAIFNEYEKEIDRIIDKLKETAVNAIVLRFIDVAVKYGFGNTLLEKYASICKDIDLKLVEKQDYHLAKEYLSAAEKIYYKLRNISLAEEAIKLQGDRLISLFKQKCTNSKLIASKFLAQAIECYRRARHDKDAINKMHQELLVLQQESLSEFQTISSEKIDVTDIVESTKELVRGKSLIDVIRIFTLQYPLLKKEKILERTLNNIKKSPLSSFFSGIMLSSDGRNISQRGCVLNGNKINNEALEQEAVGYMKTIDYEMRAISYIEPCRAVIFEEHRHELQQLDFLVRKNPFIPQGHENIFLKGIIAGFEGDFIVSAHLLVPQIENSIRYVLASNGVITSKLNQKLIQEQRLLGTLLSLPETNKIFGEDLVFELRALLIEKFGYDLRNELAHGFVTDYICFSAAAYNLWWLVVRLCACPVFVMSKNEKSVEIENINEEI